MAIRPIVVFPNPILTTPTREVSSVDDDLRRLVADMIETMHAEPGIGLAANQVGDGRRLMVVDLTAGEEPDQARVFINPRLVAATGSQTGEEGCLSFPGIFESITRAERITLKALNLDLAPLELEADGLMARCILHELDHLDGLTFLQRMSPLKRRLVLRKIERLKRDGEWPETAAL